MKKYVAAALTIGITIGPASALEAGLGGKAGGIGVGAGLSAGSQGESVGVGSSVDGAGGANVGASVGNGTIDAGVSASGNVGNTSGGPSTGIGVGEDPAAENGSVTAPGSPAAATTAPASARTAGQSIALPPVLKPSRSGSGWVTKGYPFGSLAPVKAKPGTPAAVVRACRAAIMSAATPLGAVRVNAVSAGALRQRRGALTAPIQVRIDYARQGGIEVRQARVGCRLDAAGRVTAII
ncbi:hypothetical protein [Mesorhizobium australafricanum]|uniref:Helicase n=1 Tax=Mesorhizobium australafricanum TaxID=3072311 RepID=A0ABU4WYJ3_9HYPH|nr:hypothetical protein [Mesorhizobium sp. VK3E]MDX8440854.1 hypothetical protein [Mesorhizobium sp. VK3E]